MKRICSLFLAVCLLFGLTVPVYADTGVKINVNGTLLADAEAILQNGSTLLPVRSVGNALGGEVLWDGATQTVVVTKGETMVVMPIGEKYLIVDSEVVDLTTPAQIIGGRTYVPLRVLGDALSCGIKWVNATKTVEITSETQDVSTKTEEKNKDLFADNSKIPHFMVSGLYLTEGETVPMPVVGGNWIHWSNDNIRGEWGYYNGNEVVFITGVDRGTSSLKIYESESRNGRVEGDYTEIKVYVVSPSHEKYKSQKKERIAEGYDILANQAVVIEREERLKEKLGLELECLYDVNYIEKGGVFVIPIKSDRELRGELEIIENPDVALDYVLNEYKGKPAIFIKGNNFLNEKIIIKYTEYDEELNLRISPNYFEETDILWEREEVRESLKYGSVTPTAMWELKISVVNPNNSSFKTQQKERLDNGISYEMYLNGKA